MGPRWVAVGVALVSSAPADKFQSCSKPPAWPGPDCVPLWSLSQGAKGEPGDKGSAGLLGARGLTGPKASPVPGTDSEPHVTHTWSHGCPLSGEGFPASLTIGPVCVHTGSVCSLGPGPGSPRGCTCADKPALGQSHWDSHTKGPPSPICVAHRGSPVLQGFLVSR